LKAAEVMDLDFKAIKMRFFIDRVPKRIFVSLE